MMMMMMMMISSGICNREEVIHTHTQVNNNNNNHHHHHHNHKAWLVTRYAPGGISSILGVGGPGGESSTARGVRALTRMKRSCGSGKYCNVEEGDRGLHAMPCHVMRCKVM